MQLVQYSENTTLLSTRTARYLNRKPVCLYPVLEIFYDILIGSLTGSQTKLSHLLFLPVFFHCSATLRPPAGQFSAPFKALDSGRFFRFRLCSQNHDVPRSTLSNRLGDRMHATSDQHRNG